MSKFFYLSILMFWLFVTNIQAQSESIRISQEGLIFNNGSEQVSAFNINSSGSIYNWSVFIDYSDGIKGDVSIHGYEEHSIALRVHHELYRELNSNGFPLNEQHHRALVLQKDIDKASSYLYNAFKDNIELQQIRIRFARPIGLSTEKFRITLNNVKISEIKNDLNFDQQTGSFKGAESLRLVYQSMKVEHFDPDHSVIFTYQH